MLCDVVWCYVVSVCMYVCPFAECELMLFRQILQNLTNSCQNHSLATPVPPNEALCDVAFVEWSNWDTTWPTLFPFVEPTRRRVKVERSMWTWGHSINHRQPSGLGHPTLAFAQMLTCSAHPRCKEGKLAKYGGKPLSPFVVKNSDLQQVGASRCWWFLLKLNECFEWTAWCGHESAWWGSLWWRQRHI